MELHEHFLSIIEGEPSIFEIIRSTSISQESIDSIAEKFIEDCFKTLKTVNYTDKKNLKLLRLLLCQQYKLNYEHPREKKLRFQTNLNQFLEFLIKSQFYKQKENQSILNDVVILQIVLIGDQKYFVELFENFRSSCTTIRTDTTNQLPIDWYLNMLNCFLSAWEVLNFLSNKLNVGTINKTTLESDNHISVLSSTMYDLQSWIQCNENNELRALHSVLLKVVGIAQSNKILSPYFHKILDENVALTTVCILCDFLFPFETSNIDVDYSIIHHDNLWYTVQNKLVSEIPQERKQAMYLFKRLIDFVDVNEENIKKTISLNLPKKINPFICAKQEPSKLNIKQIRTNFILTMEALEEKQKHLVIPSLSLVDSLIDGYREHVSCGNCFNFEWLYCIFLRILNHDNNAIVKWGLLKTLKLNREVYYSDHLILLIVKSLNNTFLYEKSNEETQPEIVIALIAWFNEFQTEQLHLVEKFILMLHASSWAPVPLFYILQALNSTSDKLNNIVDLQNEELDVLRVLLDRNINLYPPMLRTTCQAMLMKILSRFSQNPQLTDVIKLLTIFFDKDLTKDLPVYSNKNLIQPSCWSTLISWLTKIQYNDIISFINQICENLISDDESVTIKMHIFFILILALYKGGVICQSEKCSIYQKLKSLYLCLNNIHIRPYVKVSQLIKMIDLLKYCLIYDSPFFDDFFHYHSTVCEFILKLFHNDSLDFNNFLSFSQFLRYTEYYCVKRSPHTKWFKEEYVQKLETKCLEVLSNSDKYNKAQLLFALENLSLVSNYSKYDNKFLLDIIMNLIKSCNSQDHNNELIGKIALDYFMALSRLIKNHIKTLSSEDLKNNNEWLQILSTILDAAGNKTLIHFCDVIYQFSSSITNDNEKLEELIILTKSLWNCNFGSKRNKVFWLVSQKLTKCINSSNFFNSPCLKDVSEEFTARMLSEGESLPILKYMLLMFSEINKNFSCFTEVLLNGLLHGQVMRRDQRINMQALAEGKKLLDEEDERIDNFEVYHFMNRQCNVDAVVRAAAVMQLIKALENNNKNAALLLPLILKKLLAVQKKRYFADSHLHRLKHRLMQILLILLPYLDQQSTVILYHTLCDSIVQDSDQHSVRLMKEWMLVRIYLSHRELLPDLWLFFQKVCNERPGIASSIISVIWHISQQLEKENMSEFIKMALEKLRVCCMGQQFGIRLFGHVFFIKLYESLLSDDISVKKEYQNFYKLVVESLNCSNFKNNVVKINEDFFFFTFNPVQHYTLETIYYQLPRLSNVNSEEWITKEIFEEQLKLDNARIHFQIQNNDLLLNEAIIPYSILKSNENSKPEEIESSENTSDIQKKIIPWKTMFPNEEELSEITTDLSTYKKECNNKQNIILVASLVDKPQNIGGIARTCEIFGVKQLVVSNLKQIENKEFQALSVSADKWIKIIEVKSFSLANYLLELKDSGWTLIGAEQTANSINLCNFKYPKKTVLVLGNEKNGIPANLLPLLDTCVEIPQFGVIRSLNVHVTSAICIWEYVKHYQFSP